MNEDDPLVTSRRSVLRKGALVTGLSVVGGIATSGTAAAGVGDGRVGHYPLNNIRPDGTVPDASPENNDGMNNGASVVRGDGKVGNAFYFDGDDHVEIPAFKWEGGPVTVAFWNHVAEDDVQRSSAFGWGNTRGRGDRFQVHAPWSDQTLYWDYGHTKKKGRLSTDYSGYLGRWTHIAVVSEGAGGRGQAIYLDGDEVASKNESGEPSQDTKPFNLGRWAYGHHVGKIDEFRIYDRVLSASEIESLASMGGNSGNGNGNGRDPP